MNNHYKLYLTGFFLILFLPLLAISPWFFPPEWGKAMAFRIILSLVIFLFIWDLTSNKPFFDGIRQKYNNSKKVIWILLLILFIASLSTLFSADINFSLWSSPHRSGGLINFIYCILLSIILFFIVKNDDWRKLWDFAFIIGDLVVLFAIVQYFNLLPNLFIAYEGRPPSTLSNPILLAIYLIILTFPAISSALKEKSKKRFFYLASILLFVFGVFISGSRAAYLGIALAGTYFLLFYPKSMKRAKTIVSIFLVLATLGILYVSFTPKLPSFIENNDRVSFIANRISINKIFSALGQTRFSGWKTFSNAVIEKPIFGWGVENQAIAFDKYYDPNLNYLVRLGANWWDRAHNIFLDLSISYGIPFLIIYLFFFAYLFWMLQKSKKTQPEKRMDIHAVQSVFIAYFIALFFGFDSVTTYLVLFFIIGYSLYLIYENTEKNQKEPESNIYYKLSKNRKIITSALLVLMVIFLWQYALRPLYINSRVVIAQGSPCPEKLSSMGKLLDSKSFIDSYVRLRYVEYVKSCADYISDNEIEYIKKTINALKEGAEKQSKYTRTWVLLADFNNTLLAATQDPKERESLKQESLSYIAKAKELSPLRYEVYITEAKTYFAILDLENMKRVSEECIKIDKNAAGCYWYLGLAQIMLKDQIQGTKNIDLAREKGYATESTVSLNQLALAYSKNRNYKELAVLYEKILGGDAENLEIRSNLIAIYVEFKEYDQAREHALRILRFYPEMKQEVDEFLKTLPYPYSAPI